VAVPEEIEAVARRVRERARGDREALLLATVSGLGYYAALLVLAGIGDVSCFPTARRLWSYAGLVPSTYASGGVVTHGAIARRGPRFVCWTLVEAAMHAVRRPGSLHEFYRRLLVGKGAQKAKVALASCGFFPGTSFGSIRSLAYIRPLPAMTGRGYGGYD